MVILFGFSGCTVSEWERHRDRNEERSVRKKEMERVIRMHNALESGGAEIR